MALSDETVVNARPTHKPVKLWDERGLYLLISPAGGKWWRFRYRYARKQNTLSCGVFPDTSLAEARGQRDRCRQLLAQGLDPAAVRREEKAREKAESLAAKVASIVQVSIALDGAVEIWKGL